MHSLRARAHKEAWFTHPDDEVKTYNVWGRVKPRKTHDPESGHLQHANTDSDPPRSSSANELEEGEPKPIHKNATFPNDYPKSPGGMADDENKINGNPVGGSSSSTDAEKQESFVEPMSLAESQSEGPRRRKRDKLMPWRKSKEEREEAKAEKNKNKKNIDTSHLTVWQQFKNVIFSWINLMLVFVPVGIAMGNLDAKTINPIVTFVINFLAIIPLAGILSFATEELAKFIGEVLGGLLNASFGNAVELIVSIIALQQGKVIIVQTSLIGSMLSNLLLVMGMCFAFGGYGRQEQFFNVTVAQTAASLLALAIGSLIIPTAFRIFAKQDDGVAPTSRGTAVMLLITYGCYLFFQLKTHREVYNEPSAKAPKKPSHNKKKKGKGAASKGMADAGASAAQPGGAIYGMSAVQAEEQEEEEDPPLLTRMGALVTLAGSTVLVALCAEYMVSAIDYLAEDISQEFIGLILLPIVGNAAEHATAVTVAIKDKMDLAIGVAIGSSLQIALLVLPLMVMFSWWGLGPGTLTLSLDGFQVSVLFIAIVVVNYLIQDGKSHWLEGVLLEVTYFIIAIAAWFYPVPHNIS